MTSDQRAARAGAPHPAGGGARRRGFAVAVVLAAVALLALLAGAGPATAAAAWSVSAAERPPLPDHPLVGARLNWSTDTVEAHTARAGQAAGLYEHDLIWPLSGSTVQDLRSAVVQAARQGAGIIVNVQPVGGLGAFNDAAAQQLADTVATAVKGLPGPVFIRFAPEMNAPWEPWGLQPTAYAAAFRRASAAVHATVPQAAMVWSPAAGQGYPFGGPAGPTSSVPLDPAADTNGDGRLTSADDPYAPYFPGNEAVDWVGLDAYSDPGPGGQATPIPSVLGAAATPDPSGFYQRYSAAAAKPLLLVTGAAAAPGNAGLDAKTAWWKELAGLRADGYAQLGAVLLPDTTTRRPDGSTADWQTSSTPELAQAFRSALDSGGFASGPVTGPSTLDGAQATGTTLKGLNAWIVVGGVAALVLALWALNLTAPGLRYEIPGTRDLRVDLLRGVAIVFVVVDHLELSSLFQLLSHEAIGVVSGAELFVFLSGAILGVVSRPRIAQGIYEAVDRGWARAGKLYVWALLVPLAVFALSKVPWLITTPATTFTDQGAGAAGGVAAGSTYNLFDGMDKFLQYPVAPEVVPQFLLLHFGPWQFNVMGLYVALLFVSPFILAAIKRGWTWAVLAGSTLLYAIEQVIHVRVLPFQSADAFPLLAWQILFVVGLVAGYYLREITSALSSGWRRWIVFPCVLLAAGFMLFSWNNPYLDNAHDVRLGLIPPDVFRAVYSTWFDRTFLEPGRLLNVLVWIVAAYWVLTVFWKPIAWLLGWLLIPLGQATLYVFILHVFLVIAVANVPFFQQGNVLANTVAYALVLLGLWAMVKTRFLFNVIPR